MIAWFFASVALAADPSTYPWQAEVALPPSGLVRIDVPPGLRSWADPREGSDFLLVDGEGKPVPIARIATDVAPEQFYGTSGDGTTALVWSPTSTPHDYALTITGREIDGVLASFNETSAVATATVFDATGALVGGPTLVWRTSDGGNEEQIPLVHPLTGQATLHLDLHGASSDKALRVGAVLAAFPGVTPDFVDVAIEAPRLQENGWVRYDVVLDHALPVRRIWLRPTDTLFERSAGTALFVDPLSALDGVSMPDLYPYNATTVRRIDVGGAVVDQVAVSPADPSERFAILVDANGLPPLELPKVTLELDGVHLLVRDAGPGPHTLYAGAPPGSSPAWDLQVADTELARQPASVVAPTGVGPNPKWIPPEVASGLAGPGTELPLRGMKYTRDIIGEAGQLARIPLDSEVLIHARPDLADLRLVDPGDRQIPYKVVQRGAEVSLGELAFEREERGKTSYLTVKLPESDALISSVTITTTAPRFRRTVTVSQPNGGRLVPVRAFSWVGNERPGKLTLDLYARFGDTLVVEIDNQDNPPLPIDKIEARWPQIEVVARLPETGARLVYGDPARGAPSYDLTELPDLKLDGGRPATLGPVTVLTPPPLALGDRILLGIGVFALAIGLLGVLIALIRAVPPEPAKKPEPPAEPPAPDLQTASS